MVDREHRSNEMEANKNAKTTSEVLLNTSIIEEYLKKVMAQMAQLEIEFKNRNKELEKRLAKKIEKNIDEIIEKKIDEIKDEIKKELKILKEEINFNRTNIETLQRRELLGVSMLLSPGQQASIGVSGFDLE